MIKQLTVWCPDGKCPVCAYGQGILLIGKCNFWFFGLANRISYPLYFRTYFFPLVQKPRPNDRSVHHYFQKKKEIKKNIKFFKILLKNFQKFDDVFMRGKFAQCLDFSQMINLFFMVCKNATKIGSLTSWMELKNDFMHLIATWLPDFNDCALNTFENDPSPKTSRSLYSE